MASVRWSSAQIRPSRGPVTIHLLRPRRRSPEVTPTPADSGRGGGGGLVLPRLGALQGDAEWSIKGLIELLVRETEEGEGG